MCYTRSKQRIGGDGVEYLLGLNERQLEAVAATEGYLRVIAGAGSGKTKLLVSRYAYLVKEYGIDPGNILCVTFTNKAAGEMKRRIRSLIGAQYDTSLICTYHGFCVRVLREDIEKMFYPREFRIIDSSAQKDILADIYQKFELKLDHAAFEKILGQIAKKKASREYVAKMRATDKRRILDEIGTLDDRIVEEYLQRQKQLYAVDFNDLLYFTLDIFARCPEVLEKWQDRLNYIQVDEFQDSSTVEMELIDRLSGKYKNLMIVGDPDQNIYEWRGSDVKLLVDFDKEHIPTKTVFLNQNYRSTPQILKCANSLIDNNKLRLKKDLFTVLKDGPDVIHYHSKSDFDEADRIVENIRALRRNTGCRYDDFAVLYRSGFLSRVIEKKLTENGIPYEIFGGVKFYQRMEIRDIMAHLKLIAFDDDDSFKRIINKPRRRFGRTKLQRLAELQKGSSLFMTLKENISDPVFKNSMAGEFVATIDSLRASYPAASLSETVERVCADTGYETYIRELGDMERLENLAEFKRIAAEYEKSYGESVSLTDFISQISLQSDDDGEKESDTVKLMTIHAAKGLEFPNVFVVGLSESIFPSAKTIENRKLAGLEEERRLCYVAITRAEKRLFLLDSEGVAPNGKQKLPSRFLREIGAENYVSVGVIPDELQRESERVAAATLPGADEGPRLKAGDRVTHPAFGSGVIVGYGRNNSVYRIKFDSLENTRDISSDFFERGHTEPLQPRTEAMACAPQAPYLSVSSGGEPDEGKPSAGALLDTEQQTSGFDRLPTDEGKPSDGALLDISKKSEKSETEAAEENKEKALPKEGGGPSACGGPLGEQISFEICPMKGPGPGEAIERGGQDEEKKAVEPEEHVEPEGLEEVEAREAVEEKGIAVIKDTGSVSATDFAGGKRAEQVGKTEKEAGAERENLWERKDVPKSGWVCVSVDDLGYPAGICGMCGRQIIRYVHTMLHPAFGRSVGAGCVCAGKMEGDVERARKRERDFKNRQARRESFMSRKWRTSKGGNSYLKIKEHLIVLCRIKENNLWKFSLDKVFDGRAYKTREECQQAAFDSLDRLLYSGEKASEEKQ